MVDLSVDSLRTEWRKKLLHLDARGRVAFSSSCAQSLLPLRTEYGRMHKIHLVDLTKEMERLWACAATKEAFGAIDKLKRRFDAECPGFEEDGSIPTEMMTWALNAFENAVAVADTGGMEPCELAMWSAIECAGLELTLRVPGARTTLSDEDFFSERELRAEYQRWESAYDILEGRRLDFLGELRRLAQKWGDERLAAVRQYGPASPA
ncbi:MAG TPA: hypothetical protein VGK67_19655 [Myxococcales bacterium]|jgi:hypothetical protein